MLRISRLTDYGTVVMAYLANNADIAHNAKEIAQQTHVALPTVSKLLKLLAKAGLLVAQRGAKGGYSLALPAKDISLAQIIGAMEGNIALTDCSHHQNGCAMESLCAIRSNWRMINEALHEALSAISLGEMIKGSLAIQTKKHFTQYLSGKILKVSTQ